MRALSDRPRREAVVAGFWGVAEATVFFVVPDVFLSLVAVRWGMRRALRATVFAVVGAVVGGVVAYLWGSSAPEAGWAFASSLPGVDVSMIDDVRSGVAASGPSALLEGPSRAQPYKLFALAAGEQHQSVAALAAWTVPGRAFRFILSSVVAGVFGKVGRRWLGTRTLTVLWAGFWCCVYVWLWT